MTSTNWGTKYGAGSFGVKGMLSDCENEMSPGNLFAGDACRWFTGELRIAVPLYGGFPVGDVVNGQYCMYLCMEGLLSVGALYTLTCCVDEGNWLVRRSWPFGVRSTSHSTVLSLSVCMCVCTITPSQFITTICTRP